MTHDDEAQYKNDPNDPSNAPALRRVHDLDLDDIARLLHVEEKTRDHAVQLSSIKSVVWRALLDHEKVAKGILDEIIADEQALVRENAARLQAERDQTTAEVKADEDRIQADKEERARLDREAFTRQQTAPVAPVGDPRPPVQVAPQQPTPRPLTGSIDPAPQSEPAPQPFVKPRPIPENV